jgi:ubiquinone/menaquinone biosynthesis C-methylase UbiE
MEALGLVELRASDRVLDVAAGPGTLTFAVAPRVAQVVAVDFAPGMIEELKARAVREKVANVEAHVMDAQSLSFPDASFDAAFCMFGFMFFPDRAKAFRELARVLKPGGHAVVATWAPIDRRPFMKVGFDAMSEALPDLPGTGKGDLQKPEECVQEMSAGGFHDVRSRAFSASARVDSPEHYMRVMATSGAPLVALRKKIGEEAWARVEAKVLDALKRTIPEGGTDLAAESILTVGTR